MSFREEKKIVREALLTLNDSQREYIARILEIVAKEGYPHLYDVDDTIDAILDIVASNLKIKVIK